MEKIHVVAERWINDGYLHLRIPPGTEGDVIRHGSCKDFSVKFVGKDFYGNDLGKYVLEVNLHDDVEIISSTTH